MRSYVTRGGKWFIGVTILLFSSLSYSQIQFSDVSNSAGSFFFGESWGASWGDINGDGCPDLFVNNHRELPSLYQNNCNGTFTDIAQSVDGSGTWFNNPLFDHHGGAWADFDRDGDQDLTVATGSCCNTQFFTNTNGVFIDETVSRGIVNDGGGRMPFWFDYNRDNLIDIALLNSGTSKLMEQNIDGTFSLVGNFASGFRCQGFRSNYAQLSDLDDDVGVGGTMEVMCMQDGLSPAKVLEASSVPMTDVTASYPSEGAVVDTVVADFDGNLSPDLFMLRGGLRFNQVLKASPTYVEGRLQTGPASERELSFTASGNVSIEFHSITTAKQGDSSKIFIGSGGQHPASGRNFTVDPTNPAHQGILPHTAGTANALYVGYDTATSTWKVILSANNTGTRGYLIITAASSIGEPTIDPLLAVDQAMFPKLHMNTGGVFQEEAAARGLDTKIACVSAVAADFDNDMDQDLYVACRGGAENLANRLYMNDGAGNFTEVSNAGGGQGTTGVTLFDSAGNSDSVVTADYDFDGLIDVFITNGLNLQPFLEGGGPNELFRNTSSNSNHWVQLDLIGTTSNTDAVGAKVYATNGAVTQMRQQDGGYHRWSQNHQRIHFGLGTNQTVDLEVQWPSGQVDNYTNVVADKIYKATEGNATLVELEIEPPEPLGDECGQPNYNKATERGLFIWKDCAITSSETWRVRATSGGASSVISYEGVVGSDQSFSSLTPVSIEASFDTLDNSDPQRIEYIMKMINSGQDGFDFSFDASANVCFDPTVLPAGANVYLGGNRDSVSTPFDLNTLGACTTGPDPNVECDQPVYNKETEKGLFIWKDCDVTTSESWNIRATAGGSNSIVQYEGLLSADNNFISTTPHSFEASDVLDNTTNPMWIDYLMRMQGPGEDGFNFTFSSATNVCFDPSVMPSGATVYLGGARQPAVTPFDLGTLATCTPPSMEDTTECGQPDYNKATEKDIFIWKDCAGSGDWHLRATGGGNPSVIIYNGNVTSNLGFNSLSGFSIEANDTLDNATDPNVIDFNLRMKTTGQDGFDFSFPAASNTCFNPNALPSGAQVKVGSDKTVVNGSFDLDTQQACL